MNKQELSTARQSLIHLHKGLLEYQKALLEKETGKPLNPYEALNAALNDPRFGWLKQISQMIILMDIEIEDADNANRKSKPLDILPMKAFFNTPTPDFHEQLIGAIQLNPDISFLFSKAKQSISGLN